MGRTDVRAALAAMLMLTGPALAQDGQNRITGLKLSGDEPIQIESDKLEVRDAERKAIFTGNVQVVQGPTLLKAGRMVVYYTQDASTESGQSGASPAAAAGASNIERLEVDEKVYVKSETQTATADAATFEMATEVLVMTGKEVVLTDGPNVILGCKLTVQMRTGEAKVDGCGKTPTEKGRVKILISPKSQTQ